MKAVIFDLDDTLLHDDLTISDYTVRVMRTLHDRGVHIIPASGRSHMSMKPFVDQLRCASCSVSTNGAEIWEEPSGKLLHATLFPPETVQALAGLAEEYGVHAQVYEGTKFFYNHEGPYARQYAASSRLEGVCVGDLRNFVKEPRNKIMLIAAPETIATLLPIARERYGEIAAITCSKPWYLECNPPEATKGKALARLAEHLHFSLSEVIAFGDSLNDVSMLRAAGTGVCVANAWPEIRPYCAASCRSNNEDGVARYLQETLLPWEVLD